MMIIIMLIMIMIIIRMLIWMIKMRNNEDNFIISFFNDDHHIIIMGDKDLFSELLVSLSLYSSSPYDRRHHPLYSNVSYEGSDMILG